jgi:hypothetical protein
MSDGNIEVIGNNAFMAGPDPFMATAGGAANGVDIKGDLEVAGLPLEVPNK